MLAQDLSGGRNPDQIIGFALFMDRLHVHYARLSVRLEA
jgi:hypothetical protein